MKPKLPLLLLLLGALLSACHRQDPTTGTTTASGQVVVYHSQQPVPRAANFALAAGFALPGPGATSQSMSV